MSIQYIDVVNGSDTMQTVSMGTAANITGASKANPCVITCSGGHPFLTGDYVFLSSVGGMSQISGASFDVTYISATQFSIGVDSTPYSTYTSGGVATASVKKSNPCKVIVPAHGLDNGQWIRLTNVGGMTQLNNNVYKTANVTANTFELQDLNGNNINSTAYNTYTSGGTVTIWRKMVISGITKANPAVVTAKKHNFTNGQLVVIENCGGMTEVNNKVFAVANKTTDTFELSGIDSSGFTTYTSGGTAQLPFGINGVNTLVSSTIYGASAYPQNSFVTTGDTIKIAKTFNYADIAVGSGNIVFTNASTTVTTSVDLTASLSVGNWISLNSARLDGCSDPTITKPDLYYRIDTISSTTITLNSKYCGTTTTVSSVNRLRNDTEIRPMGATTSDSNFTAATGLIYEGGYNLTTTNTLIARDSSVSATALKSNNTSDAYFWTATDTSSIIRYINCLTNTRGYSIVGTGNTVEYCVSNPVSYYPCLVGGTNNTIQYSSFMGNVSGYGSVISSSPTNLNLNYCFATGTKGAYSFLLNSGTYIATNCFSDLLNGFNINSSGSKLVGCKSTNVTAASGYGFYVAGSNMKIDSCYASNCYYGVSMTDQTSAAYIYNSSFVSCTNAAIYSYRNDGLTIELCSFTSNLYDIYHDSYSRDIYVIGCSFTTPVNYSLYRSLYGGKIIVRDCTIDAPSINKAFNVVSGSRYNEPEYLFQNSFGLTGRYFANGYVLEDTSDYRTSSPSLKIALNYTLSGMLFSTPMYSTYVTGGVAKTITYYLKRDAGVWSGTITPMLKLNGKLIKTETNITSLNNDWNTSYSISATAGEISEDGELTLELLLNMNTIPIRIADVSVV